MPFISIIIPVYNVEAYLRECLDSIVTQQFDDYEAILIDDGSTDSSSVICDEYAERYSQLKVIHKENGGVSSARNAGLVVAKGEWIWFVDADDWIQTDALKTLSIAIRDIIADTIYFGINQIKGDFIYKGKENNILNMTKDDFLLRVQCNNHQAILYDGKIIRQYCIRFPVGMKMSEDLEFQYKYLLHCKHPVQIACTLYNLRERDGSASHNSQTTKNSYLGNRMILNHMLEYIQIQDDKGLIWMGARMAMRVKNLMKAAGRLPEIKHSEIQQEVRYYIDEFRKIGYKDFYSLSINLARIDTRLYYFFYVISKYLHKYKKY